MAVNSPGRKVQLTRLTATWPPKRMVRSRVSSVKVIRASSKVCLWSIAGVAADSDVMRGLDPRIHQLPKNLLFGRRDGLPGYLERDDFSSNRHPALSFCLSMISAQTLRVCREEKPVPTFPDHALAQIYLAASRGDGKNSSVLPTMR